MLDAATTTALHPDQRVAAHASDAAPAPCRSILAWCVAATVPKAERLAHAELHRRGFEAYLPLITARRPNRHYRIGPLWPGYLLVKLDLTRPWHPVRACPGVFSLLSMDGKPSIVADSLVESLQDALHGAEALAATPTHWKPGTPCSVVLGPANGMSGVVVHTNGNHIIVATMFLGTLRQISVGAECLTHRSC